MGRVGALRRSDAGERSPYQSRRLKLIVAYEGASFAGWQSQSHRNTVQDHLERAFERVSGGVVRVHGAGRTDAGVHALAQCAHVDVLKFLPADRWIKALIRNCLPPFAFFAADMCRKIFTRVFRQKEKLIATESGPRLFCLRSNIAVSGISRSHSI